MRPARLASALLAVLVGLPAVPAGAGVARVWAVSDGEKVARDAKGHPLAARNAV